MTDLTYHMKGVSKNRNRPHQWQANHTNLFLSLATNLSVNKTCQNYLLIFPVINSWSWQNHYNLWMVPVVWETACYLGTTLDYFQPLQLKSTTKGSALVLFNSVKGKICLHRLGSDRVWPLYGMGWRTNFVALWKMDLGLVYQAAEDCSPVWYNSNTLRTYLLTLPSQLSLKQQSIHLSRMSFSH